MSMYASKTTKGFYDSAVHGERLVTIVDPNWVMPTFVFTLKPGDSIEVDGEVVTNEGGQDEEIEVPDTSALPVTFEIPNAECLIPQDAVEISVEEWQELLAGESAGQIISWNDDGFPHLTDKPAPTEQQIQSKLNAEARAYLLSTDWYVTRWLETGVPVPTEISVARDSARLSVVDV